MRLPRQLARQAPVELGGSWPRRPGWVRLARRRRCGPPGPKAVGGARRTAGAPALASARAGGQRRRGGAGAFGAALSAGRRRPGPGARRAPLMTVKKVLTRPIPGPGPPGSSHSQRQNRHRRDRHGIGGCLSVLAIGTWLACLSVAGRDMESVALKEGDDLGELLGLDLVVAELLSQIAFKAGAVHQQEEADAR